MDLSWRRTFIGDLNRCLDQKWKSCLNWRRTFIGDLNRCLDQKWKSCLNWRRTFIGDLNRCLDQKCPALTGDGPLSLIGVWIKNGNPALTGDGPLLVTLIGVWIKNGNPALTGDGPKSVNEAQLATLSGDPFHRFISKLSPLEVPSSRRSSLANEASRIIVYGQKDLYPFLQVLLRYNAWSGSEFCVSSETFPEKEFCDKDRDWLGLWSDPETKWNLAPDNVVSGCSQYSLLRLSLDLHDWPTKLLWRPGERAESLRLGLWRTGSVSWERVGPFNFSRKADSQLPYDLTFRSVSEDGSCVVTSASLDVSRTCQMNQTGILRISIESLDDNGEWTPSYFSFNCEDGAGWQTGSTTSSPDDNSTEESPSDTLWYIAAVLGFAIVISLIEAVARRAKTCQGDPVRPSAALPSTSPAGTQEPPPPSPSSSSSSSSSPPPPPPPPPPQLLLQRNSFGPPDGQGSAQEHYGSEGGEHEYEYVELDTSRTQLAREEEDAREPDNEPVQPACSLRRDTVNSIYFLSDELSGRM
nr:uncharacterized protein LOC113830478 [Penaeus vannamei]